MSTRRYTVDYTKTWPDDAQVTSAFDERVTGVVIAITRRSDGARFTKIRVLAGPQSGDRVWADRGAWVLGTGPVQRTCADCEQPYRTSGPYSGFCQTCERAAAPRPAYDPHADTIEGARLRTRGNATPCRIQPVAPTVSSRPLIEHGSDCECPDCSCPF